MSKEIETLEKEIQSIENKEVELKNKKGILYNKMLDIAREEGRKAKALPNSYTGERGHIGSERRNAYLEVHQEECGHGSIRFGAEDDKNKIPYGTCLNCKKIITKEDKDNFIDI